VTKIRRISDFAKLEDVRPPSHKPEEFLGQDLVLEAVEMAEGTFGEFAVMTVSRLNGAADEKYIITCGGTVVKKQCEAALEEGLPVAIKFLKSGRQIYME
jgi:hypothetical protein